ncbi:MAG: GDP-L-fucose synthase [Thermodesulfobacteriota bacterium]|nr:GDP-L-fucose synthase [Thermodesulfobacteriota bacterium]
MDHDSKIFVAGHRGMVGSAIKRRLEASGYNHIICLDHKELDLTRQKEVESFFEEQSPEYLFLAAAKVGGIMANLTYKAGFIYDNFMIAANIIHSSHVFGVKKLLNLGSSCIYPRHCPQPMKEEYLLSGPLEPTNEPYAIAKIGAIKMCRYYNEQYGTDFISIMPPNLYGPNDNYDLENSHVLPALIRRIHEAKENSLPFVELWGTGTPKREFLYVDDLAEAAVLLMENYHAKDTGEFINIGSGKEISIRDLSEEIKGIVGYKGQIIWDRSKPDGMPRKILDISHITSLGWKPATSLKDGIKKAYAHDILKGDPI